MVSGWTNTRVWQQLLPKNLPEAVDAVIDAVGRGEITQQRIKESVRRILTLKLENAK